MFALVDQIERPTIRSRVLTRCGSCGIIRTTIYRDLIRLANKQIRFTNVCLCNKCYLTIPSFVAYRAQQLRIGQANRSVLSKTEAINKRKDYWKDAAYRAKNSRRHTTESKRRLSVAIKSKFKNDKDYVAKIKIARKAYWDNEQYRSTRTWTKDRFIAEAVAVHGNKYDYADVEYLGFKTKVVIRCRLHGLFYQLPGHHIYFGNGCLVCARNSVSSDKEIELSNWVSSLGQIVIRNDCNVLGGVELDVYVPTKSLGIEYHGLYWHSYGTKETGPQRYRHHFKRTIAERNNIFLMQIYEDEWRDRKNIVQSMIVHRLGLSSRIAARQCHLVVLNDEASIDFLNTNHLYGHRSAKHVFALEHNNHIVAMLSFSACSGGGYEIIRSASRLGHVVVGGFSKLLKHAIDVIGMSRVFTYADRRYSDAVSYLKSGFSLLGITPPGYRYTKNGLTYNRTKFQKHTLAKQLLVYDSSQTEYDNMFANGYRRIWDAGHYRLELILQ